MLAAMSFWSATRCLYHVVLRNPVERAVFMVDEPTGWALPVVEAEPGHPGDFRVITRAMRDRFGIDVIALGALAHSFDPASRVGESVREVESRTRGWIPGPGARWIALRELTTLKLARPDHRALLTSSSDTRRSALPWEQSGWVDHALGWIDAELGARGFGPIDAVEQVRAWEFSSVLAVTAGSRQFYFKAVRADRPTEVGLTARVAARHPGAVAPIIASDPTRHWMLMGAVAGPALETVRDTRRWEAAAAAYARLQLEWIDHGADLIALGCRDFRPARLAREVAPLIADERALRPGLRRDLSADELARLRAVVPKLVAAYAELDGYGVPATLDHADLWASNIIDSPAGPVIIDWEDACLSHPFFAHWQMFLSMEGCVDDEAGAQRRIRDAYLEPWTRYDSPKRLREAFDLAQRLAPLTFAIMSRLETLPILDASWELREFAPFYLRRLIGGWS
jgi:hypothetical protein